MIYQCIELVSKPNIAMTKRFVLMMKILNIKYMSYGLTKELTYEDVSFYLILF